MLKLVINLQTVSGDVPFRDMTNGAQYTVTDVTEDRLYFHDDDGDERNIPYDTLKDACYIVRNFPRGSEVVCIGLLDAITFSSMTVGRTYTITESKHGSVDWVDDIGDSCSEYLENVTECFRLAVDKPIIPILEIADDVDIDIQLEVDIIRSLMKSVNLPVTEFQAGVILDLMVVYAASVQQTTGE